MRVLKLVLWAAAAYAASPPITISLETSWPAPPLILEILEAVYDEEPAAYLPLLKLLSLHLPPTANYSSEKTLGTALDLLTSHSLLSHPTFLSTLNLALALHTATPRIEAAYSWYESSVDEETLGVAQCGSWVEWRGRGFCGLDDLQRDLELSIEEGLHYSEGDTKTLPFDRVSPSGKAASGPKAVFYYDPASPASGPLLNYLTRHAAQFPSFSYIIRYRPSPDTTKRGERGERRIPLAGFGVEMALKKTDYLVVDDRDTGGAATPGDSTNVTRKGIVNGSGMFADVLGEDPWSELATPLSRTEVRELTNVELGLRSSALIMSSADPLNALQELSQDFPKYSAAIARKVPIPEEIGNKAMDLARRGAEAAVVYINGKQYRQTDLNPYSLLKIVREERHLALSLTSLGLNPSQAFQLLSDPVIGRAQTEDDAGEGMVDASDRQEGGGVIVWWNDIEKDKRYKGWPSALNGYLRPTYPGQLHTIRRNTWNVVLVLDLSIAPSLETISGSISTMIQRGVPLRFGVVPMFDAQVNDIAFQMARLYYYSIKTFGRGATRQMLEEIFSQTPGTPATPGIVKLETARLAFERAASTSKKESIPFYTVIAIGEGDEVLSKAAEYQERLLATRAESAPGHVFINGKYLPFAGHWTAVLQNELQTQIGFLAEFLAVGNTVSDVSTFFYDMPGVPKRRNKLIVPSAGDYALKTVNLLDVFTTEGAKCLVGDFVYSSDSTRGSPLTLLVVGDLDTPEGARVIKDALQHLTSKNCASRLGFIHVPSAHKTSEAESTRLSTLLYQMISQSILHTIAPVDLQSLVEELGRVSPGNLDTDGTIFSESAQQVFRGTPLHAITSEGWSVGDVAAAADFWRSGKVVADALGLKSTLPHLLINGRVVGPLTATNFRAEDFDTLEVYEHRKRVKPVIDLLNTMYDDLRAFDRPTLAHLIASVSSVMASAYKPEDGGSIFLAPATSRSRYYETLDRGAMSFTLGDAENALLHVAAVLDPVSEEAQKWTPLLKALANIEHVALSVFLEPDLSVTELKLKRFYRSSLPHALSFDVDGDEIDPAVTFTDLPSDPIYTMALDTPPAFIVSPKESPYDLDNLVLSSVHSPIHVLFQLKQLLIEGHAREANNAPPRGVQLQLTRQGLEVSDTLVMANVGYLQFKVPPGVYDLAIRPGRGREVFELESTGTQGWESPDVSITGTEIVLASFEGLTILPKFGRMKGMDFADVLLESDSVSLRSYGGSVFQRMKELVGLSAPVSEVVAKKHADINIFTVASGLLYERFASIMILSVMKYTESTVKFWFIENFLSPTFIAFLPHLAEEYGFQYELVTYKWPHWLRAQTEKQRIIWAYKILFLDVLFPMDLDKVIFVDADQIVRTDMKELVDLDLQGHVYGYAPMGDDRTEMEGFRFWKTGYWKDALRGRPYHISALYVVDLKQFRRLATGDRLRGQYHALSADPNSLANLDQDLPNSMQDQIPIFTLDQSWLWCQTWCSDESLAKAKTIDLCQNPLTKEPKLVRARQIPEWDVYDKEIAEFAAKLESRGQVALGGSVDELAGNKVSTADSPLPTESTSAEVHIEEAEEERRIQDEL